MKPEQLLHEAVAEYLQTVLIAPAFFTTFPAGGGGKIRGAQLKKMGLLPGMPDLLVFWSDPDPRGAIPCVFGIELKAKKGSLSAAQKAIRSAFLQNRMHYVLCRSIDDVGLALRAFRVPHMTSHFRRAA